MHKSHGKMHKTRTLRKGHKIKGMPPVNKYLQKFEVGSSVHIDILSSEHSGMPFPRFNGQTGVVKGKQGTNYKVEIHDGGKTRGKAKLLIVNPVHLRKA